MSKEKPLNPLTMTDEELIEHCDKQVQALRMALDMIECEKHDRRHVRWAIVDALKEWKPAQQEPVDGTQVSKVWWDGEKLMTKPIPLEDIYHPVDWKAEYLKSVESGCITLDELREARVELEAAKQALAAQQEPVATLFGSLPVYDTTPPAAQQEPVEVDQATMELAESVGLIGPASRTHGLHAAIQRFHDLICVNATIKAAKMAADAIRESTPPAVSVAWKWHQAPVKTSWGHDMVVADLAIDKDNTVSVYCERDQTAKVEAMFTPPAAQPAPVQEPVAWVCEGFSSDEKHAIDYWQGDVDDLPIGTQLYTTPPAAQRQWVGLTDEEIEQGCKESWVTEQAWQSAVWWAEAKLRSKNT